MIAGYDFPRPKAENYDRFVEELTSGLGNLREEKLSLMLYGSYPSGRYQAGRSDIDAVLLVPGDVVNFSKGIAHTFIPYRGDMTLYARHLPFQHLDDENILTREKDTFEQYEERHFHSREKYSRHT